MSRTELHRLPVSSRGWWGKTRCVKTPKVSGPQMVNLGIRLSKKLGGYWAGTLTWKNPPPSKTGGGKLKRVTGVLPLGEGRQRTRRTKKRVNARKLEVGAAEKSGGRTKIDTEKIETVAAARYLNSKQQNQRKEKKGTPRNHQKNGVDDNSINDKGG